MLRSPHTNRNCQENQNSNKSVWCCIFVTIFFVVATLVLALGHGLDISKCLRLSLNNTGVIYIVPLPDMDYYYYFSEVSSAASIKPFRESSVSLYIVVSRALEHSLDILFSSNHNIHKSSCGGVAFGFWSKGHTNFYECCDLTKKVCLEHTV